MFELGINNFEEIDNGKGWNQIPSAVRPVLIFNGDIFEYDEVFKRFRNLMHDMFTQGTQAPGVDVVLGTKLVIMITATDDKKVWFRFYTTKMMAKDVTSSANIAKADEGVLSEIGPKMDMTVKRHDIADDALWKTACKRFKAKKKAGVRLLTKILLIKFSTKI